MWNRSWRPGQSDYVFCVFIVYFVWLGCNCELDVTNEVHWWGNESIIMFRYCLIVMGAIVNVVIILFNVPTAGVVTTATKWSRMDNIIAGFQGIGRSTQTRLQGATSIGTQLCPGHSGMQIWVDFHWNVSFILLLVLEKLGVSVACQINSPCYHIDDSLLV